MRIFTFLAVALLVFGCQGQKEEVKREPYWQPQESNTIASLRGLSSISENVAWASGARGTVIKTVDGGANWERVPVPESDTVDFRDIEGFDENRAIVLSADQDLVLIYKTNDGGQTWDLKYTSDAKGTFYDAMDFWDDQNGIAFGDAVDGRLLILRTSDGGESWQELPYENRPQALDGQGGFAASGTCLRTQGDSNVYIGLGGLESSLFYSKDRGETWQKSIVPIDHGPSSGIFSMQFSNELSGIAIGGDYRGDSLSGPHRVAFTRDGGVTWNNVMSGMEPHGYRSCIDFFEEFVFAVGRYSSDYYRQGEYSYTPMEGKYFSVSTSKDGKAVWVSGPRGTIAKLAFK